MAITRVFGILLDSSIKWLFASFGILVENMPGYDYRGVERGKIHLQSLHTPVTIAGHVLDQNIENHEYPLN